MRDRVFQEAVKLFARRGFAATGIRDIGREVGLTSAALYHYVTSKEELLADVMSECMNEFLRGGRAARASSDEPVIQLSRLVRFHVAAECVNPLTSQVTDREVRSLTGDNRTRVIALRDEFESVYRAVLTDGAEASGFNLIDQRLPSFAMVEMCNGVANWYRPGGRLSVEELQGHYATLAHRMVKVRSRRTDPGSDILAVRLPSEPEVEQS